MTIGRRPNTISVICAAAVFVILCSIFLYIWNQQQEFNWALPLGLLFTLLISLMVLYFLRENQKVRNAQEVLRQREQEFQALQESERKFRQLFDSASDAILLMKEVKIIDCNPKFLELFEAKKEKIIGENPFNLSLSSQPEGRESKEKVLEKIRMAEAGEAQLIEWRHVRQDGTFIDIEVNLNRLIIQGDNVVQAIIRDITERKKTEDQLIYLSFNDKLTGLYNRAYFEDQLKRLDTPRQLPISIIMGDVNGLKLVNDVFGHHEGDKLLIRAAQIIKNSCRK